MSHSTHTLLILTPAVVGFRVPNIEGHFLNAVTKLHNDLRAHARLIAGVAQFQNTLPVAPGVVEIRSNGGHPCKTFSEDTRGIVSGSKVNRYSY